MNIKLIEMLLKSFVCWCASIMILTGVVFAQTKKEPPPRKIKPPLGKQEKSLPTIDVPEFIITGKERIELEPSAKINTNDSEYHGINVKTEFDERDRSTAQFGNLDRQNLFSGESKQSFNARVLTSYGTFRMPRFEGWFGTSANAFDVLLHGDYQSVGDYVPYADSRKGSAGLTLKRQIIESNSTFSNVVLSSGIDFNGHTYHLYGSSAPSLERTIQGVNVNIDVAAQTVKGFSPTAQIFVSHKSVDDATKSKETVLGLGMQAQKQFDNVEGTASIFYAGDYLKVASPSVNPNYFKLGGGMKTKLSDLVAAELNLFGYLARHSNSVTFGRVYPKLNLTLTPIQRWTVFAQYSSEVKRSSLASLVERSPYISNDAIVHHQDVKSDFTLGARMEISKDLRTQAGIRYQRIRDYPICIEDHDSGVWNIGYDGLVSIVSFETEALYSLSENDFLTASLTIQNATNDILDAEVPDEPSVQLSTFYQHRFSKRLATEATVTWIGHRANLSSSHATYSSVDPYLTVSAKGEYRITEYVHMFLSMDNLLNQHYEHWKHYLELPFTMTAGIVLQW
jgi:outer membrane receptor protein involved in Fe transport